MFVRSFTIFFSISRYTSETLTTNVAELRARVKTITSRVEQAADVQLQRQFHGFLEVSAQWLISCCLFLVIIYTYIFTAPLDSPFYSCQCQVYQMTYRTIQKLLFGICSIAVRYKLKRTVASYFCRLVFVLHEKSSVYWGS